MIHCAIILTTTCANLSLISDFSPLKMNSSPDTAELDTTNHEKLLKFMREKSSRHFLEPLWGVGATASREYMTKKPGVHKGCLLCGSKAYICLGSTCLGSNLPMLDTCTKNPTLPKPSELPGQVYKKLGASNTDARNPGPKKVLTQIPTKQTKSPRRYWKKKFLSAGNGCNKKSKSKVNFVPYQKTIK